MELLGVLFNHDIFPDNTREGYASYTCIFKEDPFTTGLRYFHQTDEELVEIVLQEFRMLFPGTGSPVHTIVDKWRNAIPLYTPQHYHNLLTLEEELPSRYPHWRLFGNYTGQISVRGMAQEAAKVAL
jgi:protoporphyrinogen oxidase